MKSQRTRRRYNYQTNLPQELLAAIEKANSRCLNPREGAQPCTSDEDALLSCKPPKPAGHPEAIVPFRKPLLLLPVLFPTPEPEDPGRFTFHLGCLPFNPEMIDVALALDLLYEQRWCLRKQVLSACVTTVSLAPNETLRLTLRNSQRKVFDQTTIKEVEQSESTESTIVDRDVLNVTRSSSVTNNWNVSGNASVSIPIKGVELGLDFGGGVSEAVANSSQTSSEQVEEATQKSATTLRTLQKVEVKETTETIEERDRSRLIVNPYRDRSLCLNVYSLAKEYRVDFVFNRTRPLIIIEFKDILFDRAFVLANGDFLDRHLQDARLRLELSDALEKATDQLFGNAAADLEQLSLLALRYLFDVPNIFNVNDIGGTEANTADSSFDASLDDSGLHDATENQRGIIFTTLNFYFRLYRNEIAATPRLAPVTALSLEQALRPMWLGIEESDSVSNVLDASQRTEGFRRLGGFLAFVSGAIRPLLQPAEEEKERTEAARRSEFVISRILSHLQCHKEYYIEQYLIYLSRLTGGVTLKSMLQRLLSEVAEPADLADKWIELFSIEEAFVDRTSIVIPGFCTYDEDTSRFFLSLLDGDRESRLRFGVLSSDNAIVPCDGAHLEAAAGGCVIPDVPPPSVPPPIRVSLEEEPLHVLVTQEGQ